MPPHRAVAESRGTIIAAAHRLLARHGYGKTTIDDLAREAGIGKGSVYLHFTSKEDVALAAINSLVAGVLERLAEIAATLQPAEVRLAQMLETRVLGRFDAFRDFDDGLHHMLQAIRSSLVAQREQHLAAEARIFAGVLAEIAPQGLHSRAAITRLAHTLLTATNSMLPYYLTREELGTRRDVERRVTEMSAVLVPGAVAVLSGNAR